MFFQFRGYNTDTLKSAQTTIEDKRSIKFMEQEEQKDTYAVGVEQLAEDIVYCIGEYSDCTAVRRGGGVLLHFARGQLFRLMVIRA